MKKADQTCFAEFFNNGSWRVDGSLDCNSPNNYATYQLVAKSTASAGLMIYGDNFSQIRFIHKTGPTPAAAFQMIGATDFRMYFTEWSMVDFNSNVTQLYKDTNGKFLFSPLGTGIIPAAGTVSVLGSTSDNTAFSLTAHNSLGANMFKVRNDGVILMENLPVAAAGLPAGSLWNNGGVVNIV